MVWGSVLRVMVCGSERSCVWAGGVGGGGGDSSFYTRLRIKRP